MTAVPGERFRLYQGAELEAVIDRMARQAAGLLDAGGRPVRPRAGRTEQDQRERGPGLLRPAMWRNLIRPLVRS